MSAEINFARPEDVLEFALNTPKGIVIEFRSAEERMRYRARLHSWRVKDRMQNKRNYQPGEPLFNTSAYDVLTIQLGQNFTLHIINSEDGRDVGIIGMHERTDEDKEEV